MFYDIFLSIFVGLVVNLCFFFQELGKMWANVDVAEKERLQKKSDKLKEVYEKEKAAYDAAK